MPPPSAEIPSSKSQIPNSVRIAARPEFLELGIWDLELPAAEPPAGDRRDSNPQQPEPQSGALPLSYGHQQRVSILVFRTPFANGKPARDWHAARSIMRRGAFGRCDSTSHMSNLGL